MPRGSGRVTVIADTTQGGRNGHGRGRQQPIEPEGGTAGAGAVAHRPAAAGSQRPRARGRPVARRGQRKAAPDAGRVSASPACTTILYSPRLAERGGESTRRTA